MEMSFPHLGQEGEDALRGPERLRSTTGSEDPSPFSALPLSSLSGTDKNENIPPFSNLSHGAMKNVPAFLANPHATLEGQSRGQDLEAQLPPLYSGKRTLSFISLRITTPNLSARASLS